MLDSSFLTPTEALLLYKKTMDGVDAAEFFRDPAHGKSQDIWMAVKFALSYESIFGPCKVNPEPSRLDIDADFEILVDEQIHPFQSTEALEPDRRRGDEYSNANQNFGMREADWSSGSLLVPKVVRNSIELKISKHYARACDLNLLIKINVRAWEYNLADINSAVRSLQIPFKSVWLLSGAGICSLIPHPELGNLPQWVQAADWDET